MPPTANDEACTALGDGMPWARAQAIKTDPRDTPRHLVHSRDGLTGNHISQPSRCRLFLSQKYA